MKVSDRAHRPGAVEFNGVAQIMAHFNFVALGSGHTSVTAAHWATGLSAERVPPFVEVGVGFMCVLAVRFDGNPDHSTWVVLNVCPKPVDITPLQAGSISRYRADDAGGWGLPLTIERAASPAPFAVFLVPPNTEHDR